MNTTELEHVRGVWERTKNDSPIYRLLLPDVDIISATRGQMQARLKLTAEHVNSRGTVHGAVSAAIIDWAGGMSIATHGYERTGASIDIHVSYLSTATIGDTLDISAVAGGEVNGLHHCQNFPSHRRSSGPLGFEGFTHKVPTCLQGES